MKSNAYLNGQDILNWYKTPFEMEFTDKGFPILEPLNSLDIPRRGLSILPFNYALSNKDKDYFIHFYIQDYLFNRIWNNPQRYIDVLKEYKGIVMPDFSLYTDMPEPLQRFNHYRNLWFARMCQMQGITVIPSPNWSTRNSLNWCLEGMHKGEHVFYAGKQSDGTVKKIKDKLKTAKAKQVEESKERRPEIRVTSTYNRWKNNNDKNFAAWFGNR